MVRHPPAGYHLAGGGGRKPETMTDNNPTEAHPPAGSDEAQQEAAQASDAKASAPGWQGDNNPTEAPPPAGVRP